MRYPRAIALGVAIGAGIALLAVLGPLREEPDVAPTGGTESRVPAHLEGRGLPGPEDVARPPGARPPLNTDAPLARGKPLSWLRLVYEDTQTGVSGVRVDLVRAGHSCSTDGSGLCAIPTPAGGARPILSIVDAWSSRFEMAPRFSPFEVALPSGSPPKGTADDPYLVPVLASRALSYLEGVVVSEGGETLDQAWVHVVGRRMADRWAFGYHAASRSDKNGRFSVAYVPLPADADILDLVALVGAPGYRPRVIPVTDASDDRIVLQEELTRSILKIAVGAGAPKRSGWLLVRESGSVTAMDEPSPSHLPSWVRLTQLVSGVRELRSPLWLRLDDDPYVAGYDVRDLRTFQMDVARGVTMHVHFTDGIRVYGAALKFDDTASVETIVLQPVPTYGVRGHLVRPDEGPSPPQAGRILETASVYVRGWRVLYEAPLEAPGGFEFPVLGGEGLELVVMGPYMRAVVTRLDPHASGGRVDLPSLEPMHLVYEIVR